MERWLHDAAIEGNVNMLLNFLNEDPVALERSCVLFRVYAETPLHKAVMLGHLDIVREILNRKPSLASKVNLQKSTSLHLATATDNVEMVALLFNAYPAMCLACDQYRRNSCVNGKL